MHSKTLAVTIAAVFLPGISQGAGFQLWEQGISGLGAAYATSASAEDASTIYWNPAGMTRLPGKNVAMGLHLINPSAKFENQGSTLGFAPIPLTGGTGGDAGGLAPVPNAYYSHQFGERFWFGIGMNSQFGLKTEYDNGWVGRYHALTSDLKTININPSIAFKLNDVVSLGGGINYLYAKATLSNAIDFGTVCFGTPAFGATPGARQTNCTNLGLTPQAVDGKAEIKGDDTHSFGFNLGAMFQVNETTRIGLAYRSQIKVGVDGDAKFTGVPAPFAATFASQSAKAEVTLPDVASVGVHAQITPLFALAGDVQWTNWSKFKELRVQFGSGLPDNVTPENWDDSLKVAIGAIITPNNRMSFRVGVALDESPVPDEFRTPRIPDSDRKWLSFGASFKVGQAGAIDVGYTHVFVDDATLNLTSASTGNLIGKYEGKVDILSFGYRHSF